MTHKLSYLNPEGEVSTFKIDWFTAIQILIFKRAWQAQFLHHTLVHKTKNVYFFNIYKWFYYHILIFLLASILEKSLTSFHSRVQSSLLYQTNPIWQNHYVWCSLRVYKDLLTKYQWVDCHDEVNLICSVTFSIEFCKIARR